mmetsp:Transcript_73052/g.158548  ORF Transcript_73052/g.158548 Transcript_73052/m.158548 type:complete len:242 (+) Transcript_73052:195-920(+)
MRNVRDIHVRERCRFSSVASHRKAEGGGGRADAEAETEDEPEAEEQPDLEKEQETALEYCASHGRSGPVPNPARGDRLDRASPTLPRRSRCSSHRDVRLQDQRRWRPGAARVPVRPARPARLTCREAEAEAEAAPGRGELLLRLALQRSAQRSAQRSLSMRQAESDATTIAALALPRHSTSSPGLSSSRRRLRYLPLRSSGCCLPKSLLAGRDLANIAWAVAALDKRNLELRDVGPASASS